MRRAAALAPALVGIIVVAVILLGGDGEEKGLDAPPFGEGGRSTLAAAPFELYHYREDDERELERRAAAGNAHVIYAKSPGGVALSAVRTAIWRPQIDRVTKDTDVDPDVLEAIVLLESAGRPEVIAGDDPEAASGLTQILAETGSSLLGMRIDLRQSRRLTRRIARAERRGQARRVLRLRAARRRIDERFRPDRALAATVRYLEIARERFGRDDLAIASYHMGIGNLETALRRFAGGAQGPIADVVGDEDLSYAKLFFGSSPLQNQPAWSFLARLGDDSSTYLWRVRAALEIMRLHREDSEGLARISAQQTAKGSAEEVLRPLGSVPVFETPGQVADAYRRGALTPLPARGTGWRRARQMGELANRIDQSRALYRGLAPGALAVLDYLGAGTRTIAGGGELIVTSTVRDRSYQGLLLRTNREATPGYSLHTTGWAFDILRRYRNREHALAFQFMLDRLQSLNAIAWLAEPAAIHMTVGPAAADLVAG